MHVWPQMSDISWKRRGVRKKEIGIVFSVFEAKLENLQGRRRSLSISMIGHIFLKRKIFADSVYKYLCCKVYHAEMFCCSKTFKCSTLPLVSTLITNPWEYHLWWSNKHTTVGWCSVGYLAQYIIQIPYAECGILSVGFNLIINIICIPYRKLLWETRKWGCVCLSLRLRIDFSCIWRWKRWR